MDTYEAILTRQTIRDFAKRDVPWDVIQRLIEAGLNAPSNDHLRRWEFVVLRDKERQFELASIIGDPRSRAESRKIVDRMGLKDPIQREMYINAIPKQHAMIADAGCVIVPVFYERHPIEQVTNISSLNGFASIWCCIENILIAASAEGIYGVTRIPMNRPEAVRIAELLGIPEDYRVPCCLALGYPAEGARRERQLEYDIDAKIHRNHW